MSSLEAISTERYRLLAECCFAAVAQNRIDLASDLADALKAARPADEATYTAQVMVALSRNQAADALKVIDEGIARNPDSQALPVFRGMALLAGGFAQQAEAQLQPLAEAETGSPASLATALLRRAVGKETDEL